MSKKKFGERVIDIIKSIPKGKVMTYSMIAREAGSPNAARFVGGIISKYKGEDLPWHRVINSRGYISIKTFEGYQLQKSLLEMEGVHFDKKDKVDLTQYT